MTTRTGRTLLLSGREDQAWARNLRAAVEHLGKELSVARPADIRDLPWRDFDLVILDAGGVDDAPGVISQVLELDPDSRIVVFTSSPTWEQARETMLAGAVDYSPKVFEHARVLEVIKRALDKRARKTRGRD